MTIELTYPDVRVALVGEDGNAFSIIGRVARAIRQAHGREAADAFTADATSAASYDELLYLVMNTVTVGSDDDDDDDGWA